MTRSALTTQASGNGRQPATIIALLMTAALLVATAGTVRADPVTDANLDARIASAQSAADHQALATFYRAEAAASAARAKKHEAMLASYKNLMGKPKELFPPHCTALIHSSRQDQQQFEEMAAAHEAMAKAAAK